MRTSASRIRDAANGTELLNLAAGRPVWQARWSQDESEVLTAGWDDLAFGVQSPAPNSWLQHVDAFCATFTWEEWNRLVKGEYGNDL